MFRPPGVFGDGHTAEHLAWRRQIEEALNRHETPFPGLFGIEGVLPKVPEAGASAEASEKKSAPTK